MQNNTRFHKYVGANAEEVEDEMHARCAFFQWYDEEMCSRACNLILVMRDAIRYYKSIAETSDMQPVDRGRSFNLEEHNIRLREKLTVFEVENMKLLAKLEDNRKKSKLRFGIICNICWLIIVLILVVCILLIVSQ
ncbi:hypothetical protein Ancab_040138 [Ancistrocladus abbreviatus]